MGWVKVVQRPVYQQFGHHRQLLDRQRYVAARTFQIAGKARAHDVERGQGFAGVSEQGGCVDVGEDGEDVADGVGVIGIAEAGTDASFGDLESSARSRVSDSARLAFSSEFGMLFFMEDSNSFGPPRFFGLSQPFAGALGVEHRISIDQRRRHMKTNALQFERLVEWLEAVHGITDKAR
jgi:hypothetical protein